MNWEKLKFVALLVVLSICVLAAGWGMRFKGADAQGSGGFKVIPYDTEVYTGWVSDHPYSAVNADEHDVDKDPNKPKGEHPSSLTYEYSEE